MNRTRWQALAVVALLLWTAWFASGNFVSSAARRDSSWLPKRTIRLGLDLRGGLHWVLQPDYEAALDRELDLYGGILRDRGTAEGYTVTTSHVEAGQLRIEVASVDELTALRDAVDGLGTLEERGAPGNALELGLQASAAEEVRGRILRQILEVLRRRIGDPEKGVPESVVTRQGRTRALVQVPGGQEDRDDIRDLIDQTGSLNFHLVKDTAETKKLLESRYPGGLPEGTVILAEYEEDEDGDASAEEAEDRDEAADAAEGEGDSPETARDDAAREASSGGDDEDVVVAYLVNAIPDLTGDLLTRANSRLDQSSGWVVDFTFNSEGGRRFGELTEANIGRLLAIALDDRVYSAPNIRSRIGSQGFIEGSFSPESAGRLAVILRAGKLPVSVRIEEERSVGPALGADSIRRGTRAAVVGLLLVMGAAMVYYGLSGVYASLALVSNMILLTGVMSMSSATLTLPGIAGLVLTVGMAVDANVIVFERIREELRQTKAIRAAIRTGFQKALWTILDANITTFITAVILFQYGTGPIKGFAVTLSIGIVTSVFSTLVITRLLYEIYPGNRPVTELSV